MNKIKISNREIKNRYNKIIAIPYCDAQHLLTYETPTFYNCGVYGWNYDAYIIDDICILTGYRNFFGKEIDYKTLRKAESKAYKRNCNYETSYKQKKAYNKKVLVNLCNKALTK